MVESRRAGEAMALRAGLNTARERVLEDAMAPASYLSGYLAVRHAVIFRGGIVCFPLCRSLSFVRLLRAEVV